MSFSYNKLLNGGGEWFITIGGYLEIVIELSKHTRPESEDNNAGVVKNYTFAIMIEKFPK